jgi:hypothetical protein
MNIFDRIARGLTTASDAPTVLFMVVFALVLGAAIGYFVSGFPN